MFIFMYILYIPQIFYVHKHTYYTSHINIISMHMHLKHIMSVKVKVYATPFKFASAGGPSTRRAASWQTWVCRPALPGVPCLCSPTFQIAPRLWDRQPTSDTVQLRLEPRDVDQSWGSINSLVIDWDCSFNLNAVLQFVYFYIFYTCLSPYSYANFAPPFRHRPPHPALYQPFDSPGAQTYSKTQ